MTLIWATRGRSWGFRFLLDGGLSDPLVAYESAFKGTEAEAEVFRRSGDTVTLRFLDPSGRTDHAGRVIPHDFVVSGEHARELTSLEDGVSTIWPLVQEKFEGVWDKPLHR